MQKCCEQKMHLVLRTAVQKSIFATRTFSKGKCSGKSQNLGRLGVVIKKRESKKKFLNKVKLNFLLFFERHSKKI